MSEEREKLPKLSFAQDKAVTFEFQGDTYTEIYSPEYDNTNYPHEVLGEDGERYTVWISKILLSLLSRRGGNGPGNKYTCILRKEGKKYNWEIKVLNTSGNHARCTYTNREDRSPADVDAEFELNQGGGGASEGSGGDSGGGGGGRGVYPQNGAPGTFEGDVGLYVESFAKAALVLKHPAFKASIKDLDIGEPMMEQLMTIAQNFYIGANQRGEREPSEEAFVFPSQDDIDFQ